MKPLLDPADLNLVLLVGAGLLLVAVAAVRVSTGAGLPSLLLYLAIGLAVGEAGLGICSSRTPSSPRSSAPSRWP